MVTHSEPTSVFPIVGVGASAGGLEAFTLLLQSLPADTGMAFVLIQHLDPVHHSQLAELLAKTTKMPVVEVATTLVARPDHVYVIAPNTVLLLAPDNVLRVEPRIDTLGVNLPVDRFFKSLAEQRSVGAIGVVLSGSGSDGTLGLEEIKAAGGVTFAQDEVSARFNGMPQSARHSGCIDVVMPPDRIAAELVRIGLSPYMGLTVEQDDEAGSRPNTGDEENFQAVLALLRQSSGVDFSAYRDTTVKRRLMRRLMLDGSANLSSYLERLKDDRPELDALYQDILINVTSFFREPEAFEALKTTVFPAILAARSSNAPIRVWVPGCSTGQEAYSLAMVLLEFLDDKPMPPGIQVFATDLSEAVCLLRARAGVYPASIESEVSPARLRRFFEKKDGQYCITKTLREMVIFARQNVAADPPFSRIDLVSCRNLLIYLAPPLQKRVIPTFHYALNPSGFLLLGASETVGSFRDLFTAIDQPNRIYERKTTAAGARAYPHFRAEDQQARIAGGRESGLPAQPVPVDWQREADRVAVAEYVPPGVLVNENFDILQFRGQTGDFLAPASGDPSHNLLKMAREGLFVAARSAVIECQRTGASVRHAGVQLRGELADRDIDLRVLPVKLPQASARCFLILFEESNGPSATLANPPQRVPTTQDALVIHQLQQELGSTREYLESMIEQQDAANEELKSANEEISSSNEELQSTNEELETAKEELQSVNEELTTINEQLQHRNAELGRLSDDTVNLLASSGVPMLVLGIDLRIRRFTPAAGRLFELEGDDVGRAIGALKWSIEQPDLVSLASEAIATMQVQEREVHAADGRNWMLRVHPYRTADNRIDGAVLVMLDTHELQRAQTELLETNRYIRAILDTVREPLIVLDSQLRILSANPAFFSMFATTPADTEGQLFFELGNGQWDALDLRSNLSAVLSPGVDVLNVEVKHEFEQIGLKVMQLNARKILREGKNTDLLLLAIEDRTELTRLEEQAEIHLARLVEDDRRKMEFLALLAHELRNPLAPIRNCVNLLERTGHLDEPQKRAVVIIDRQARQLTRLVDDLLDVARINTGKVEVRSEQLDLVVLLAHAVEAAQALSEPKRIKLTAVLPGHPVLIEGDPVRLLQAIGNLINNACKFSESGGNVDVVLETVDGAAIICINDDGIGIDATLLPRVFDMFMQGDRSIGRISSGLGIGLALVKQVIEATGGTVEARSAGDGKGSEFEVRLPRTPDDVSASRAISSREAGPPSEQGMRILVVDDNADAAESLGSLLTASGHDVRIAFSGEEAIALGAAWRPNFMLIDIGMPGMDGHETLRQIRRERWGRAAFAVAHTGWGQPEDRRRSVEAGFDAHVVKPLDFAELAVLLKQRESRATNR